MYLHKSERQPKVRLVVLASTVIDARSNLISLVHRSSTDRPLLITRPTEYVCFERQGESASSRCVRFSRDARNLRATLRIRAWIERKCFRFVGDVTDHRDARLRNIAFDQFRREKLARSIRQPRTNFVENGLSTISKLDLPSRGVGRKPEVLRFGTRTGT